MRRVGHLARRLFERNFAHVTTVRPRSSPDGEPPGPSGMNARPLTGC
jgi:hypothetical protein